MRRAGYPHRVSDFGLPLRTLLCGMALALALHPNSLRACAACYGQSDSPMAAGMNWGIMSLLVVIAMVLGGVSAFFIYLARRSARAPLLASTDAALPHSDMVVFSNGTRQIVPGSSHPNL